MNTIILDGKIIKSAQIIGDIASFNFSAITGKFKTPNSYLKNRYTFIRVLFIGDMNDVIRAALQEDNFVRLFGYIDSEQYLTTTGKIVYNKIIKATDIKQIVYNIATREYEEVLDEEKTKNS